MARLTAGVLKLQPVKHGNEQMVPAFVEEVFRERLNILEKRLSTGKSCSDPDVPQVEDLGNGVEQK